jgi:hypothetical protein
MDGGAVSFDQKRSEGMWFTVAIDPWVTVRQDGWFLVGQARRDNIIILVEEYRRSQGGEQTPGK